VVLAECDPAGGDLAYRLRSTAAGPLAREPGVISLAAAARPTVATSPGNGHRPGRPRVADHCQVVLGGLPVLRGPLSAEHAAASPVLGRRSPPCSPLSRG